MKKLVITLLIIISLLLAPLAAQATLILVGPGDLTGSRSTPATQGVEATDGWTEDKGGFKISWNISEVSSGIWNYVYEFKDKDGATLDPDVSHLILEVSASFASDNIWSVNGGIEGPKTWGQGTSNPFIPGDVYGIKFDFGSGIYSFTSDRAPVWGDFYVKDGKHDGIDAAAWNSGFGTDPNANATDFTKWVPTPDTSNGVVPEPGTLMLLGSGLLGMAGYARVKFGRKKKEI